MPISIWAAPIAGTVTDSGGHPITSGLCATATMTGDPGSLLSGSSSQLDSAGRYTIPGLPTGSYTVSFYDCRAQRNDVAQTFATTVSVTLGQPTIGVNATMLPRHVDQRRGLWRSLAQRRRSAASACRC